MRIDVLCPSCGQASGLDTAAVSRAGTTIACASCGFGWIVAAAQPVIEQPTAERSPAAPHPDQQDPVVCPRCSLHFVPRRTATAAASGTRRPRILLVEDMEFFAEIARGALESRFEVVTAGTLGEARRALASGGIELMMLDLVLEGGTDGRQLLRELPFKPCPILIFTARDESEMYGESWQELQRLGADDLVVKGMHMGEALSRKVAALLHMPATEEAATR